MKYALCGITYSMSEARQDKGDTTIFEYNARPRVGVSMIVGPDYTRGRPDLSESETVTGIVTEILEDTENRVVFRTEDGSEYTWEIID